MIAIEMPQRSQRVYDQAITITGKAPGARAIAVWMDDRCLAETRVIGKDDRFRLLTRIAPPLQNETPLTLIIRDDLGHSADLPIVAVPVELDRRAYGEVLPPDRAQVLHRENIYGFGPPVEHPSEEALALVLQFLPRAGSVLDFGCGAGAFGPGVIAAGHRWMGVEVQPECAAILARRGLPFRHIDDNQLPFADREFDAAIAIEVLEHIAQLDDAIREIARVTRARFLVSVPNMEVIPYFAPLGVVPWHLLESTHVNFFTRTSLRETLARHFAHVEVFSYGEHPVRTADGLPVHLHLFAVADR